MNVGLYAIEQYGASVRSFWCCSSEHGTGWVPNKVKQAFTMREVVEQLANIGSAPIRVYELYIPDETPTPVIPEPITPEPEPIDMSTVKQDDILLLRNGEKAKLDIGKTGVSYWTYACRTINQRDCDSDYFTVTRFGGVDDDIDAEDTFIRPECEHCQDVIRIERAF